MKNRAYSFLEVKSFDDEKRIIKGIATTPSPDRVGDIIDPLGAVINGAIKLLWMHNHELPVGSVVFGKATKAGIPFEASIPKIDEPNGLKARVDEAWASVKHGLISAVSIGFRSLERVANEATGGIIYRRIELLELSLVSVPANAGATINEIKSFDNQFLAALGTERAGNKAPNNTPGVTGQTTIIVKTSKTTTPKEGKKPMSIAEQKKQFAADRLTKMAKMKEIMDGSKDETLDVSKAEEFDTLEAEVKAIDKHLVRLNALEVAEIDKATDVPNDLNITDDKASKARGADIQIKSHPKPEKGMEFAQFVKCLAAAKGNPVQASNYAQKFYPGSNNLNAVLKAAVAGASTTDAAWAGNLLEYRNISTDFVELLRPQTILGRLGQNGIPSARRIPFNVHIKGQSVGMTANWVGEGAGKPVTKAGFTDTNLGFKKLAAITIATEEMLRFGIPGTEALLRDSLIEGLAEVENQTFVDPSIAEISGVRPASITNGVTPIESTGNDVQGIACDIAKLWAVGDAANYNPNGAVYITDVRTARSLASLRNELSGDRVYPDVTMNGGSIDGVPLIVSNYVPDDTSGSLFILAYMPEIWLADDALTTIDVSREASIQMDSSPTVNSKTGTGASLVSMFQTNSVAIRAERYVNWKKRRPLAVSYLAGVNWDLCA